MTFVTDLLPDIPVSEITLRSEVSQVILRMSSLDELLTAEFKEAFDEFDKVCPKFKDYKYTLYPCYQ